MQLKPANWWELWTKEGESTARIAQIARRDTIDGGCLAMLIAERAARLGLGDRLRDIVRHVYANSTGEHCPTYEAWKCPECGNACLGQDSAYRCCLTEDQIYDDD